MEELTEQEQEALVADARNWARLMEKSKEELVELLMKSNKKALIGMQAIHEISEIVTNKETTPRQKVEVVNLTVMDKSLELISII